MLIEESKNIFVLDTLALALGKVPRRYIGLGTNRHRILIVVEIQLKKLTLRSSLKSIMCRSQKIHLISFHLWNLLKRANWNI